VKLVVASSSLVSHTKWKLLLMVSDLFRTQECDFRRGSTPLASALESTANGWQVVLKTIVRFNPLSGSIPLLSV
jgi:hypothetical protein